MNIVTLIGNLATDVELREVGPEKKVASFLLAVDRASRDGGADFVNVCAWDRQAELCAEYLAKGRRDRRRRLAEVALMGGGRQAAHGARGRRAAGRVPRRRAARGRCASEGGEVIPFEAPAAG